ncbi:MAG: thioredoxin family protein [Magnetococcus sp. YQC-9]
MKIRSRWTTLFVVCVVLLWTHAIAWAGVEAHRASGRLIVFTTEYCSYCQEFMHTVGPVYAKTELGKRFPMEMVDNFAPPKEWEARVWEIRFYPTFLVLDGQNRELGRFRGYRGEEPFWSELETIASRDKVRKP